MSTHLPEGQACAAPAAISKSEAKLLAGQAKYIRKPEVARVLLAVCLHPLRPLSPSLSL